MLPVVVITVCPNLPWSTDHWPHKYALTLLWCGRDSFSFEIAKLWGHAFILSAIMYVMNMSWTYITFLSIVTLRKETTRMLPHRKSCRCGQFWKEIPDDNINELLVTLFTGDRWSPSLGFPPECYVKYLFPDRWYKLNQEEKTHYEEDRWLFCFWLAVNNLSQTWKNFSFFRHRHLKTMKLLGLRGRI